MSEQSGFSTKELLEQINGKLDRISDRFTAMEVRIAKLELFQVKVEGRMVEGDKIMAKYIPMIENVATTQNIKEAVAQALSENTEKVEVDKTKLFSKRDRLFAGFCGLVLLVLNLLTLGPDLF